MSAATLPRAETSPAADRAHPSTNASEHTRCHDGSLAGGVTASTIPDDSPALPPGGAGISSGERHCKQCSAVLVRKEGETEKQFQRRQFCDRQCSAEWQRGRAPVHPLSFANTYPRIKQEWPAEERFDRKGMIVADNDRVPFRIPAATEWIRWI